MKSINEMDTSAVIKDKVKLPNYLDIYEYKYTEIEEKIKVLANEREELRKKILEKFEEDFGHQSMTVKSNITGNIIQRALSVYQSVNEEILKRLLTIDQWEMVTERKVSPELLKSAIKMDNIQSYKIAEAITTKEVERLTIKRKK
jgi:hypothetical protein